ncbi:class I SAM-dependent methyltransferase [Goodfellowiella coeruleoviolacea]|uniref:Ubiquinone/menaquinone biosynthesis C-methylase UbiE n=1 Tax=Goodfellowiella coeruleoviolacea TaxID=334858 RepID=A0AAE3G819_9PSEU|nr:class I SAM-dependent methyltransferase [Goodfellowiella coeruleoviolacea]MCP2163411.1 Ubiquinone/menaquinone biosynthesis C-methylase UbiE [Goodfellowiella coeruleoviolacea]
MHPTTEALDALAAGDVDRARAIVRTGGSLLAEALSQYLATDAASAVYDQPAAFEAFINGGGNIGLYRAVSAALAGIYDRTRPASLLDIGCGDGRALLPSLAAGHRPSALTLVEPAAPLLAAAVRGLAERGLDRGLDLDARNTRVEPFAAALDTAFDLAQSTFALHTLPHEVRDTVLAALAPRVGALAVVEFDVPDLPHAGPEHRAFLARTYERGLAEYDTDRDLVAQGFLMPVLTGQLVPGATRVTWEQPAARWAEQVERAGFTDVRTTPLCDYWSSPAFLLTATGQHRG